jgi:cytochrome c553
VEPVEAKATDMHRHFDDVTAIQQALISGDLLLAQSLAKQTRAGFAGPAPEKWGPFIERTVASAEMMEAAKDLDMAARVAATMAGTCGDCHSNLGIHATGVHVEPAPTAEGNNSFSSYMRRHRWAADRMWDGLIGPSDAAWNAGVQVLISTPLKAEDVSNQMVVTPEIEALLKQVEESSTTAQVAQTPEQWRELYGGLLAGCASCHRLMISQHD